MILTFILLHMEPGSVARAVLGLRATPARVAIFDDTYGLNKPVCEQFAIYVKQLLHGNLGVSYQLQQPVSTLIAERLPRDALLLGLSTLLALIIGVPAGIYQAVHHNQLVDDIVAGTWFTLYSAPDFMEALLLIALLCVQFHVFQPNFPGGITSVGGLLTDWRALVLPVVVLSINSVASFSQYARSTAIQELAADYVRVARAKGVPPRQVLTRHVLRNSLLPVITILGMSLPSIVAGAVIAEAVFNFPGMGQLFSGMLGGLGDAIMMRIIDTLLAVPTFILLIIVASMFTLNLGVIILILSALSWPGVARLVRAQVLSLRTREFALAAKTMGANRWRILLYHMVPNTLGVCIVTATFGVADSIYALSALSFLGIGPPPPFADWGTMLTNGVDNLFNGYWWQVYPALIVLVIVVLAFRQIGDALNDIVSGQQPGRVVRRRRRRFGWLPMASRV